MILINEGQHLLIYLKGLGLKGVHSNGMLSMGRFNLIQGIFMLKMHIA